MNKLPRGMSLLDYLWSNFGGFKVSNEILESPNPNNLVTEKFLVEYLKNNSNGGIVDLKTKELEDKIQLIGINSLGNEVCLVEFDKEDYLVDITLINRELIFTMISGKLYIIYLDKGAETNTIITKVVNNKIESYLKIDLSTENPTIDISSSDQGLKINLKINPENKQLKLIQTDKGLDVVNQWDDESDFTFAIMSYSEYKMSTPIKGRLYFITDMNCLYVNGILYGTTIKFVETNTILLINNNGETGFEVKVSPNEFNLTSKTSDGLLTLLLWEELV